MALINTNGFINGKAALSFCNPNFPSAFVDSYSETDIASPCKRTPVNMAPRTTAATDMPMPNSAYPLMLSGDAVSEYNGESIFASMNTLAKSVSSQVDVNANSPSLPLNSHQKDIRSSELLWPQQALDYSTLMTKHQSYVKRLMAYNLRLKRIHERSAKLIARLILSTISGPNIPDWQLVHPPASLVSNQLGEETESSTDEDLPYDDVRTLGDRFRKSIPIQPGQNVVNVDACRRVLPFEVKQTTKRHTYHLLTSSDYSNLINPLL
ncbi:unnamed protein product, partial [Protopolystoma xenopodis]